MPPLLQPFPSSAHASPRRTLALALTVALALSVQTAAGQTQAGAPPASATPAGTPAASGTAELQGVVYDSLATRPLAGATVQAARADDRTVALSTETDSLGVFRFAALAPGRYVLGFLHPTLDMLGIELKPVVVELGAGARGDVALGLPGPASARAALCPATPAGDSSGAVAGAVRDAESGSPATGASVVFTWSEVALGRGVRTERRRIPVPVRADGSYLACGVPADADVEVSATAPGRTSGLVALTPPPRGLLVRPFLLGQVAEVPRDGAVVAVANTANAAAGTRRGERPAGDTTRDLPAPARGTARATGVVVTETGAPVGGARVRVVGAASAADADAAGRFTLTELPAGTFTLEARAIGRQPAQMIVDLVPGQAETVRVVMAKPAVELERVVVRGRATSAGTDVDGFAARRRSGLGIFMTADQTERERPRFLTDLFRMTPGMRVAPGPNYTRVLRGRDNCVPRVFLDGNLVRNGANEIDQLVGAEAVGGIEVYRSAAEVPAAFNGTGQGGSFSGEAIQCGAVVLWTRR